MKKILLIGIVGSFVFAGINFNKSMVYGDLDGLVTVNDAMGVDFDLNDSMSLGYDTAIGMLVKADGPVGLSIRLGWNGENNASSLGVGYNWWNGGEIIKTSIGTALDYYSTGAGTDDTTIRINITWGF